LNIADRDGPQQLFGYAFHPANGVTDQGVDGSQFQRVLDLEAPVIDLAGRHPKLPGHLFVAFAFAKRFQKGVSPPAITSPTTACSKTSSAWTTSPTRRSST
jgi:hypothetical protein